MKTFDDKARQFATEWLDKHLPGNEKLAEMLAADVRLLLKEQDRDTRHAIAEALSEQALYLSSELIHINKAQHIAMNTQGG